MDAAVKVTVDVPEPGAAIGFALKLAVTPEGTPVACSEMAEFSPPETVVVTEEFTLEPAVTVAELDELIVKAGVCVVVLPPVRAAIRPAFGLPQPVTRS